MKKPRSAYLWSKGFVPRLQTYAGRKVPNPLQVEIVRGEADIEQVLADVLALTKLNYNACNVWRRRPGEVAFRRFGRRDPHCGAAPERLAAASFPLLHLKGRL